MSGALERQVSRCHAAPMSWEDAGPAPDCTVQVDGGLPIEMRINRLVCDDCGEPCEPGPFHRRRWFSHGRNGMSLGNATLVSALRFALRETLRGNLSTVSRRA